MFIIPIQELDEIKNDHFGSGDAQTQYTNDEVELQEQPRKDDVDEEERGDPPDCEKNESRSLFLTHCRYVDKSFIAVYSSEQVWSTSPVKQYSYENDFSCVFDALPDSFLVNFDAE